MVTSQPVIDEENKTITFKVSEDATPEELKTLAPTITVSDKATVTPGSGVAQNFAGNVVYTVVAEDGTTNQYTVSIAAKTSVLKFSFEEWENVPVVFVGLMNMINLFLQMCLQLVLRALPC